MKGLTCEKVLHQRTLHVWRKHILENQSGTNLGLCGNVAPTICVPALQSASLARSRSPPPSSSPLLPPPTRWFWRLKPEPHKEPRQRPAVPLLGQCCLTAPRPPARVHLSVSRTSTLVPVANFFPLFLFSLAFLPLQSFVYSALCSVWQRRARKNPHNRMCAHTHTYAHTQAVTDTQLGPSCTQRQGFGNQ